MENTTSSHLRNDKEENEDAEKMQEYIGKDGLENSVDEYNMNLYGEFIPSFNSWILMDDQRERIKEITEDNENLWKNNK